MPFLYIDKVYREESLQRMPFLYIDKVVRKESLQRMPFLYIDKVDREESLQRMPFLHRDKETETKQVCGSNRNFTFLDLFTQEKDLFIP